MYVNTFSMSNFLSTKIKNKEKYELNDRSGGGIGKDKEKEYGSITSLVQNEVRKKGSLYTLFSLCVKCCGNATRIKKVYFVFYKCVSSIFLFNHQEN